MPKYSVASFYFFSHHLGWLYLRRFFHAPLSREGWRRLLIPMDIIRYFELPQTAKELDLQAGESILDLSSPKLLAWYLSATVPTAEVIAVDIWSEDLQRLRKFLSLVDPDRKLMPGLKLSAVDGRRLGFPEAAFDKAYAVSVLEHVPDNGGQPGDSLAVAELGRILKPGGRLVLTVPYARKYAERYVARDVYANRQRSPSDKVLWSRYYDDEALQKRIVDPAGLRLIKKLRATEKYPILSDIHGWVLPLSASWGNIYPLFYALSVRTINSNIQAGRLSVALLVLEKAPGR
jgi:SAM-dependent methyltransferase